MKKLIITIAGIALLSGGIAVASQHITKVDADTTVSTKVKSEALTLKLATQYILENHLSDDEMEKFFNAGFDFEKAPDSTRVLAVYEGDDEPNELAINNYGWEFAPASTGISSYVEDASGRKTQVHNLNTNPDATSVGEIRAAVKAARGE